eukprot:3612537-Rhodomonas_salina.1
MSMKGKKISQAMEDLKSPIGMGLNSVMPNQMNLNTSANYTTITAESPNASLMQSILPSADNADSTALQDISAQDIIEDDAEASEEEQPSLIGRVTEKLEKKDPSAERRKVAFDSAPRSAVKWRELRPETCVLAVDTCGGPGQHHEGSRQDRSQGCPGTEDCYGRTSYDGLQCSVSLASGPVFCDDPHGLLQTDNPPHTDASSASETRPVLQVTVIEAKGLPKVDEADGV